MSYSVRHDVLTQVLMKSCRLVKGYERFGGTQCLHLRLSALRMKVNWPVDKTKRPRWLESSPTPLWEFHRHRLLSQNVSKKLPICKHIKMVQTFSLLWDSIQRSHKRERLWLLQNLADCILKKWSLWMWSLGRMKQFSFLIGSRTSQQTQRSEIVCYLPPVMYGVFDSSGNHSLNGQQFQTNWTDIIT